MELFNALGLDIKLIIAQWVNFAILLFVLYKFAYGPILEFIKERTDKISRGVKDAELSSRKLEEAEIEVANIIRKANENAEAILRDVTKEAEAKALMISEKSKIKILDFAKEIRKSLEDEKRKILRDAKAEISDLVVLGVEKIIGDKVDKDFNQKWITKKLKK